MYLESEKPASTIISNSRPILELQLSIAIPNVLEALANIAGNKSSSSMAMLIARYAEFADTPDRVCLCGALAGEIPALLLKLRDRVDRFFTTHQWWLAEIPKRAVARGEFKLSGSASKTARLVFAALQGALVVRRTTAHASQMTDIISALKSQLASA